MKDVTVVLDLQFGSTGKGQIAGNIAQIWRPDTVVCANGPNAGHTFNYDFGDHGGKIIHTVLPVCAIIESVSNILLGPGAVFDVEQLHAELSQIPAGMLTGKMLVIHPNAALVHSDHRLHESRLVSIGSTMKGTSEAMIEKIRRGPQANIARNHKDAITDRLQPLLEAHRLSLWVSYDHYDTAIDFSQRLLVEGAQGSGLSINSEFYPHATSRDVSLQQLWVDCRLPARHNGDLNVIGVVRTYPIRVANRWDAAGKMVGTSGGCFNDQHELKWSDIGREAELTTVTKLPRRLFTFSTNQIIEAARYNSPTCIALTFCDYLEPDNHRAEYDQLVSKQVESIIRRVEAAAGCDVGFLTYGPLQSSFYSPETRYDMEQKIILARPSLPWER